MPGARLLSQSLPLSLLLLLLGACGGANDAPAQSAISSDHAAGPGSKKPRGDGALESLNDLRERLREPGDKKQLDLAAKGWGAELGRILGEAASLDALENLDLSDNELRAEGIRDLLGSSHLGALMVLDLGGNAIGDDGARALADGTLSKLTTLNLSGNGITVDGAKALARGKGYPALHSLDLSMNPVGADGVRALGSAGLPQISELYLLGSEIGPSGARAGQGRLEAEALGALGQLAR
jgi:hypothetical protein